ncbi:hypothetical protein VTK73DRAFT_9079 [Phialemonium thermophilum]|uniref:Nudix hydrolase domain-containing protein n=1 Tax=Phialemonium thermophilum TaxID=223376 RepID=A0ABR3W596_9PEZI
MGVDQSATVALDLDEIDRSMSFHPSDACVVSCGTVTIDPAASKVLLIWNRQLQIHQLPKGRKNIGEDMLSAALRETYEETGVPAAPLRLKIATRATPPAVEDEGGREEKEMQERSGPDNGSIHDSEEGGTAHGVHSALHRHNNGHYNGNGHGDGNGNGNGRSREVTEGLLSTEFIGCCRYPDPQSSTPAEKVVFYYAAVADSTQPRRFAGTSEKDRERLQEVWTPASEAPQMLRFRAEAEIVRKALMDARRSGYHMAA